MKKILKCLVSLFPDSLVIGRYCKVGSIYGDLESYSYMGEIPGLRNWLAKWVFWEEEIVRRGYRAISLDNFILYGGGYVKNPPQVQLRLLGEEPKYHARIRQEQLALGKPEGCKVRQHFDGSFTGSYTVPSTEE